ncbi:bifunctional ornithine acetyltransferase/N-acetylglutamate synthase [Glaciimonas immobilis]|uniref:Glutamate N-acetyltransferase n=2 Tax=Glaciimonas immobilis TaxID=728004 RepID=A0A840RQH1_9BURK|nr:bifunctional ornithine acetyltransferase/N-acetylglutamate synthase [Glaciimonas immobilis]KAF3997940.1 hypothetical protein HAV38_10230 [Glaciimonas immobilis]MBB5199392.1 hypothetical protein [Glaciimonas immobilis]
MRKHHGFRSKTSTLSKSTHKSHSRHDASSASSNSDKLVFSYSVFVKGVGKWEEDLDITPERTQIFFGETEAYPQQAGEEQLEQVRNYLKGNEIIISIKLNIGSGAFTAYGCDLSEEYIRINADYTT